MPLIPIKPSSIQLVVSLAALTSFALIRELVKDGARAALNRMWKGAWIFVHPRTCFEVVKVLTSKQVRGRSEEHTSELQSLRHLVCRLLLEKKKKSGINLDLESRRSLL